ncbi:hypothetical protein SAMN05892877_1064 [Rhizobium subbaraonis]|uniref:Uncharacterized protein n=1 Tax=Rhizobium subbaraonis TaxID=908946 RepID=A0A285UCC8_9HYPH|nr:hypothetical protein [Rhizobium subbaraonis]SOC39459.1 hypothetical protein SAMN05892877_1064 [Rhizobium subbaraonis]
MFRSPATAVLLAAFLGASATVRAEEASPLPPAVTFAVSTGYWQDSAEGADKAPESASPAAGDTPVRRGYYKLFSLRQPDGTAKIYLQRIEMAADGPSIASSSEIEAFSAMKAYVTDIRPESSDGVTAQPGMFATIHLKTDPKATRSDSWTVLIDDLGEMRVEKASN